ncbi:MAG: TonB-dependent receptor [Pseudoxanthomonas suwonensis]|nr:TonB-dependent receptor [Pseudoxanthomonas suwonensis]
MPSRSFLHVPPRNRLSAALLAAMVLPFGSTALAQEQEPQPQPQAQQQTRSGQAESLDRVVVTGSLIPQTEVETFVPVTVITADDIQARGFNTVSEVLQESSMSTGGVQGAQSSASFTQGAETVSLFGLPPGYVKYLIDGRPMANYPALYNGSDTFNNISGIPVDMVERIEILPGGQSSLYGSDAIAGVINVILKKRMDGSAFSIRGGAYSEGGGGSFRTSFSTGFSAADDRLSVLLGVQYEERDPIWGHQRDITSRFFEQGQAVSGGNVIPSPPIGSRDFLVHGPFSSYRFMDPANCANTTDLFDGGEGLVRRPGFGDEYYCGSFNSPGYRTLLNGKESGQFYGNATFDISDNARLYGNVLVSNEQVDYHVGSSYTWWGTGAGWGYFFDPRFTDFGVRDVYGSLYCDPDAADYATCVAALPPGDIVNLQRAFAPEDMGPLGFRSTMSKDKSRAVRASLGVEGGVGQSDWTYDVGLTHAEYTLDSTSWVRWADKMNNWFETNVLGPQLGTDPYFGYAVYQPDYAAFYRPINPVDFWAMSGFATTNAETKDSMLRASLINSALFGLPGGDAGLAVVGEVGRQSWNYNPDPGFLDGSIWGQTDVSGGGERDRYALTTELRMPLLEMLTVTASARYDAFKAGGRTIDKPTYSLGIEFRPMESLLLRGKYGTAFRSPTLSDLYQGESGFYTFVTDYWRCSQEGFEPGNTQNCRSALSSRQIFGTQSGNLDLNPINADVWSAGMVWAPVARMSLTLDYHSWDISDEVTTQSANGLMLQEYRCRTGADDMNSALCTNTLAQITRNAQNMVTEVYTPKINVSNQQLEAITAGFNYAWSVGGFGDMSFRSNFTQKLNHDYQQYAEDEYVDLLNDPYWSSDPKRRADASLTWRAGQWSSTAYAAWRDRTPNYRSRVTGNYGGPLEGTLGSHTTYNWSLSYRALENLDFSLMVNNVFNKMPPLDLSYPGTTGAPYNASQFNPYGRAIYGEIRYRFGGSN